jgi:hypothetical protein
MRPTWPVALEGEQLEGEELDKHVHDQASDDTCTAAQTQHPTKSWAAEVIAAIVDCD